MNFERESIFPNTHKTVASAELPKAGAAIAFASMEDAHRVKALIPAGQPYISLGSKALVADIELMKAIRNAGISIFPFFRKGEAVPADLNPREPIDLDLAIMEMDRYYGKPLH